MEELQVLWRKASAKEEGRVSQSELAALVSRRSSDELGKFKQVIKMEYIFTCVTVPLIMMGAVWNPKYLMAAIPLFAMFAYLLYFYRRALRQFDEIHFEDDLRTYLQRALRFLKSYVSHYKIICWASGLVGLLVGYLVGREDEEEGEIFLGASPFWELALVLGGIVAVLLFCHFYIKYLYQARINSLEKLLQEFSAE